MLLQIGRVLKIKKIKKGLSLKKKTYKRCGNGNHFRKPKKFQLYIFENISKVLLYFCNTHNINIFINKFKLNRNLKILITL